MSGPNVMPQRSWLLIRQLGQQYPKVCKMPGNAAVPVPAHQQTHWNGPEHKNSASSDPFPAKRLRKIRMTPQVSSIKENGKENIVWNILDIQVGLIALMLHRLRCPAVVKTWHSQSRNRLIRKKLIVFQRRRSKKWNDSPSGKCLFLSGYICNLDKPRHITHQMNLRQDESYY